MNTHIKSEKHQNYVKFKKPTDSVDKLIKNLIEEKMKILQNMIDKFTVIQRFILKQLKRKEMETEHDGH